MITIDKVLEFVENPVKVMAAAAPILASYILINYKKNLDNQFSGYSKNLEDSILAFRSDLDKWSTKMTEHMIDTRRDLKTHNDNFLSESGTLRKKLEDEKFEVTDKASRLIGWMTKLEAESKALRMVLDATHEKFDQKFGRVIHLEKENEKIIEHISRLETACARILKHLKNA